MVPARCAATSSCLPGIAGGGVHDDTTPRYAADAAPLSWRRTIEFFDTKLV